MANMVGPILWFLGKYSGIWANAVVFGGKYGFILGKYSCI